MFFYNKSVNIDSRTSVLPSLDSSHQDDSNKSKIAKIQSLDRLNARVCRIRNFENTPVIRNSGRNYHINSMQTQM